MSDASKDTTTAPFLVKSQRHLCWAARDQYLDCINKAYGVDAPSADPQSKCTRLLAEFEKACPKSWVQHFKQRREADIRDRKLGLRTAPRTS